MIFPDCQGSCNPNEYLWSILVTLLSSTASLSFALLMCLVAFSVIKPSLYRWSKNSRIRPRCMFFFSVFKSTKNWHNVPLVTSATNIILPTTATISHNLKIFGHVIYTLQNTAKPLSHSRILNLICNFILLFGYFLPTSRFQCLWTSLNETCHVHIFDVKKRFENIWSMSSLTSEAPETFRIKIDQKGLLLPKSKSN